jgi:putative ABC transport system permease protein
MFTVITDELNKLYDTFNFDIAVVPTEAQDFERVRGDILAVEGVAEVFPGVGFNVEIIDLSGTALEVGAGASISESTELPAFGFDPATSTFDLTYTDGNGWSEDPTREGVVLSSKAADLIDKKAGDSIVVSAGGRTAEYEVIGVHSYPFAFVGMKWQDLARLAGFVTSDNGTPDDFTDDTPLPTVFFASLEDHNLSGSEVAAYIDRISERILASGITAKYENQVQQKEDDTRDFLTFQMIFQITSAVMAAVGAIGLLTTLSMAVFERQKEIGVMRSIGARSSTIVAQFMVEGILIGVIAWLVAIPLSYFLAVALLNALEFSEFVDFHYPLWVLGLGLVGMIVVAAVASLWPSLAAARRTVSDILRYQ